MSLTTMSDASRYYDESQSDRLARKSKEAPFFPIAIGVFAVGLGYGAYMYRYKGKMSTSVYLMHLRVGAQGAAVASLTIGLIHTMINEHILKKK